MKCEYVKLNWQHEYPMPNDEDAVLVRHLMEDLADKYGATSLKLNPEFIWEELVYVYTFKIPEKFSSKEYNKMMESILDDAHTILKKLGKEDLMKTYTVELTRW